MQDPSQCIRLLISAGISQEPITHRPVCYDIEHYNGVLTLACRGNKFIHDSCFNCVSGCAASSMPDSCNHFRESMQFYGAALKQPTKLGGFKDRCDVQYNYACAACLSGHAKVTLVN